MVDWYLGTIGFSYKDWEGVFYPAGLATRSYLAHYSQIFNAVELDSTFYGIPPAERVQQWAAATPDAFKFCVKTPREITHELRLVGAQGTMTKFLNTMRLLGPKLGAVLIQLPPSFTDAEISTINTFLAELPPDLHYAVEFRHESWYTPATVALLETFGIGWVAIDYVDLPKRIETTTDFLYIRWLGQHGRFAGRGQERLDVMPQLQWWWEQLQMVLDRVNTIYGFFNNDYAGHSPSTCNRFKAIAGLPSERPELPQQDPLF